jgi:hypothetical protein
LIFRASKAGTQRNLQKYFPQNFAGFLSRDKNYLAHDRVNETSTPSKGEAVMNPQTVKQSDQSPSSVLPLGIENPYVTPSTAPPVTPKAADYAYRIALLTAGIVLLATVV